MAIEVTSANTTLLQSQVASLLVQPLGQASTFLSSGPVIIDSQHHYEAINVEAQRRNPSSLWWRMRRQIHRLRITKPTDWFLSTSNFTMVRRISRCPISRRHWPNWLSR